MDADINIGRISLLNNEKLTEGLLLLPNILFWTISRSILCIIVFASVKTGVFSIHFQQIYLRLAENILMN